MDFAAILQSALEAFAGSAVSFITNATLSKVSTGKPHVNPEDPDASLSPEAIVRLLHKSSKEIQKTIASLDASLNYLIVSESLQVALRRTEIRFKILRVLTKTKVHDTNYVLLSEKLQESSMNLNDGVLADLQTFHSSVIQEGPVTVPEDLFSNTLRSLGYPAAGTKKGNLKPELGVIAQLLDFLFLSQLKAIITLGIWFQGNLLPQSIRPSIMRHVGIQVGPEIVALGEEKEGEPEQQPDQEDAGKRVSKLITRNIQRQLCQVFSITSARSVAALGIWAPFSDEQIDSDRHVHDLYNIPVLLVRCFCIGEAGKPLYVTLKSLLRDPASDSYAAKLMSYCDGPAPPVTKWTPVDATKQVIESPRITEEIHDDATRAAFPRCCMVLKRKQLKDDTIALLKKMVPRMDITVYTRCFWVPPGQYNLHFRARRSKGTESYATVVGDIRHHLLQTYAAQQPHPFELHMFSRKHHKDQSKQMKILSTKDVSSVKLLTHLSKQNEAGRVFNPLMYPELPLIVTDEDFLDMRGRHIGKRGVCHVNIFSIPKQLTKAL